MNSARCAMSLLLASCLILFRAGPAVADVVKDTCRKCAGPNVNYDYCVKALGSDPGSKTADVPGLGLIALTQLENRLTSTGAYIQQLLKQNLDPYVQKCLKDCSNLYSDAADTVKESVGAFRAKHYADVQTWVSAVSDNGDTCESQFKDKPGLTSPLTKQNGDAAHLSFLELAILALIKG